MSVSWLKNRTHKPPQIWLCFQTINFGSPIILSHRHRGPLLFPWGSFHCFPQFPRDRAAAALGHGWPLWPAYESWESLPGKIRSRSPYWGQLQGNWLSTGTVSCQICNDHLERFQNFSQMHNFTICLSNMFAKEVLHPVGSQKISTCCKYEACICSKASEGDKYLLLVYLDLWP